MDYSKFDGIGDSDSDSEEVPTHTTAEPVQPVPTIASDTRPQKMVAKGKDGRYKFEYEGRTIYEWEQALEEVNIYLQPPPGVTRQMLEIKITFNHLQVGIKGAPPFIDEDTGGPVKIDESMWMIADGEININLQKMNKAELWTSALVGRHGQVIDEVTKGEVKKKMMLDRFQEEHPNFDFSGADFNGEVPEARDFMGGIKR